MKWKQFPYKRYIKRSYGDLTEIRRFRNCVVLSAEQKGRLYLILEEPWQTVTLCEYKSLEEREEDIHYLQSLPPGDGAEESGFPVLPLSPPPSRTTSEAKPLPLLPEESVEDSRALKYPPGEPDVRPSYGQ